MKKVFKVLGIIVVIIVVIIGLFIGGIYSKRFIKKWQKDNDRINNSKTLSDYIRYHTSEYTDVPFTSLDFHAQNIKCDLLKDRNILYYANGILVLDDYTIYETAFNSDKVYSNGQQYKQIETDFEIKRIVIESNGFHEISITSNGSHEIVKTDSSSIHLISEDNEYYRFNNEHTYTNTDTFLIKESPIEIVKMLLNDKEVIKFVSNRNNEDMKCIVLKNDGQIYEQQYDSQLDKSVWKYTLLSENVLYTNDYGYITDFVYVNGYVNGKNFNGVSRIISDKGLYYSKQTNQQQYIDTEPTFELVISDIYTKYKTDINYIDSNYIFTTDNNIIETYMLCRDIDKEVK